jgi:hypothetical protein
MFTKKTSSTPATNGAIPRGFLKGTAKTGINPVLPQAEWPTIQTIPKVFEVVLSPDNQEFLALAQGLDSPESLSQFINSLLWQERFRQGYPVHHPPQTHLKVLNAGLTHRLHPREWFRKKKHVTPQ